MAGARWQRLRLDVAVSEQPLCDASQVQYQLRFGGKVGLCAAQM